MNVIVTKEIKLIKMEKQFCKRRKFNKNKTKVFKVVTKINVACMIRTNNAELKNISVQYSRVLPNEPPKQLIIAVYKKYHMHFRISRTMNAEDIFRCSIGCEIMLIIKARIRLIFSRYNMNISSAVV